MHPADEFDAFKALIESGMPAADVAARFGVTETVVKQRLKLANVSPTLIAAYRNGEMTLQHAMAFAVTDDHAAQERVWNELSEWQKDNPEVIRDMLTEHEITAHDRRVKFVTLEAYEKAGGTVRRDLFSARFALRKSHASRPALAPDPVANVRARLASPGDVEFA